MPTTGPLPRAKNKLIIEMKGRKREVERQRQRDGERDIESGRNREIKREKLRDSEREREERDKVSEAHQPFQAIFSQPAK